MKNLCLILVSAAFLLQAFCNTSLQARSLKGSRPNIVFVMTDDQGMGDLSCMGNQVVRTPNIDQLYLKSMRLTDYQVSPTCAPTRAALMSGRMPFMVGVTHTIQQRERMALDVFTMPQALKSAGYTTGLFGKWHLGDDLPYLPQSRGFDEVLMHGAGGIGQVNLGDFAPNKNNVYFDNVLLHNDTIVQTKGFCTDVFFQAGLNWIKQQKDSDAPYFAYISLNAPHAPLVAPKSYTDRFQNLGYDKNTAGRYGMIENIDDNVGLLMQKLQEWNQLNDTLVIFTTDNGATHLSGQLNGERVKHFNYNMKGAKNSPNEGGTHVPAFLYWKGVLSEGVDIDHLIHHVDLFPTFAELAGAELPDTMQPLDGRSILPLLAETDADWPDRERIVHCGRWPKGKRSEGKYTKTAVRTKQWRLVNHEELYDIANDPGETTDIASASPDVVERLRNTFDRWWESSLPMMVNEDLPTVKGPDQPLAIRYEEQLQEKGIPDWAPAESFGLVRSQEDGLAGTRPNIILVMTDDQGYGDLSCHGHPYIKTPHIDAFREQSMRFEDFHVSSSCAPTRAAIMSGVHPFKVGVTHTIFHRDLMALDKKTIAQVMKDAGYSTGIFGKWHLGDSDPYQPHNRGFDESLVHGGGIAGSSGIRSNGSYNDMLIRHNGDFVQTRGFCTDVFFGQAMHWMKQKQDAEQPFFACIFPNAPHGPWSAPKEYADMYQDIANPAHKSKAGFFAMISNIDDNMGLLIENLDQWGMAENTLLIFTTDNGSVASSVYNAGMRGGKTSVYEGGSRVPFFARWPGKVAAGQDVNTLTRHFDLLPTFAELAGADISDLSLDGKSLVPLMQDPNAEWPSRTMFYHKGRWGNPDSKHEKHRRNPGADNNKFNTFAVRDERWRLTVNRGIDRDMMLCDIINDPGEEEDVRKQYPEITQELLKHYGQWWDECRPLMINEDADITKGGAVWPGYLKEQKTKGSIPELIIPGVTTDRNVISMSTKGTKSK